MTKKELLEAIKDMPMDAEIYIYADLDGYAPVREVGYDNKYNTIDLC